MTSTIFVTDGASPSRSIDSIVVSALDYIKGAPADAAPGTVVMHVGDTDYLTLGYYVSLVAEARGHRPLVTAHDILARPGARSDVMLDCLPPQCLLPRSNGIPRRIEDGRAQSRRRREPGPFRLGVLLTKGEPFAASSLRSVEDLAGSAALHGLQVCRLGATQLDELDGLDGLLIRDLAIPVNHTYHFARRAAELGIPVLDDPVSIVGCSDKVFVHERLARHGVATPRTLVMTPDISMEEAAARLGLPLVFKIPTGSFCVGIHKACSRAEGDRLLADMRRRHPVIIAQEYLPTEFDWRIAILNGAPLFACKYYMAKGHWQVIKYADSETYADRKLPEVGEVVTVRLGDVPPALLDCATRAAAAFGKGFYGVDIKEQGGAYRVIEVNCNPDMDSGSEVTEREWSLLAAWFRGEIERARDVELRESKLMCA